MERHSRDRAFITRWFRDLFCGTLIGAGAILPGVSGGVLAVAFDIYRPFMEILTSPRTAIPKYRIWFPPLAAGWCIGFLAVAKWITMVLALSETVTTWLFIGLIAGTMPQLWREAGREGRSAASWVSLTVCAAAVFAGLFYVSRIAQVSVMPNFLWYAFCGVLWGAGAVIPGLTASSVLMALGLYEPVLASLTALEVSVLSAALPGMLLTVLLLARLVTGLFRRFYSVAFHGIFGMVLASTLVIIPVTYSGEGEAALSAICCIGGFLLAFAMAQQKIK